MTDLDAKIARIRASIARQEERYANAFTAWDNRGFPLVPVPVRMTASEADEEMRKAGARLYNLRRELTRLGA